MGENKFPSQLDHLNKTFLEELSYKLWVTKGSRFHANKRLLAKNDWSNKSNGFLSAYLIVLGLVSVYQISMTHLISPNFIAFASTAISIMLLAFSQMEAAQDYKTRAHNHLHCSLEVSKLYNELRIFKTMESPSDDDKIQFCKQLSKEYQSILDKYPNHETIDFSMFQTGNINYFKLSWFDVQTIFLNYYYKTTLLYHILIALPIFSIIIAMFTM